LWKLLIIKKNGGRDLVNWEKVSKPIGKWKVEARGFLMTPKIGEIRKRGFLESSLNHSL
jgi:hypothetical protein